MTKLTDLQLVLLSTATTRVDGSLLPPAASITTQAGRIRRTIATLVERDLAADIIVMDQALSYRADGDMLYGAAITDAGHSAMGAEPPTVSPEPQQQPNNLPSESPASPPASKTEQVLALLRGSNGASLDELVAATGWLSHTTRAALTGLRQKGHAIARSGKTGSSRYHLAA